MINFNFVPFDGHTKTMMVYANTPVCITTVDKIDLSGLTNLPHNDNSKTLLPWIQMYDNGVKLDKCRNDEKMTHWNNCVYVDFDSKKYNGQHRDNLLKQYDELLERVKNTLSQLYTDNFFFAQKSFSGTSSHFIFFFNVERTLSNFMKCADIAQQMFRTALKSVLKPDTANEIITAKGVIDKCSERPEQGLFMSGYDILYNIYGEPSGKFDIDNTDFLLSEPEVENDLVDAEINTHGDVEFKKFANTYSDWSHLTRFSLAKVLAHTFKRDVKRAETAYMAILPSIADNVTNHTLNDLQRYFKQQYGPLVDNVMKELQKPIEQRDPVYGRPSIKMLKLVESSFTGINHKITTTFIPQRIENTDYTKHYQLLPNQFLSDVFSDILRLPNNFIHIEAGCGLGKTFALKQWIKEQQTNAENLFDVQTKKRVCFVTPMTSINRDNFTNESDWVIVDSEHKGNFQTVNNNKCVCTTWNSFNIYEMDQMDFDLFVFDESHSLFLYDYRAKDIADILYSLNRLHEQNKRVVLLTGTPSKDRDLFSDMAKVRVTRYTNPVKANVIIYNEQYNGWLFNDVREWIKEPNHIAVVMNDYANITLKESFEKRGIAVDLLYNKRFDEDVQFVTSNRALRGQVTLVSTYGQAGINIENFNDNDLVRIYIINDCALSIIQYANRIRNKERVESINILYKHEKVTNSIRSYSEPDRNDFEKRLELINKSYSSEKDWLVMVKLGLNELYIKDAQDSEGKNTRIIDNDVFRAFYDCQSVVQYESQLQMIYNRLCDADFMFNVVYLDEDFKDTYVAKKSGKAAGILENKNVIIKAVEKSNLGGLVINDKSDKQLRQLIDDTTKNKLEYIVNYLFDTYTTDLTIRNQFSDYMAYIDKIYSMFIDRIRKGDNEKSVTKADVKRFAKAIEMKKKILGNNLGDSVIGGLLCGEVSDEMIMSYAAAHVAIVYGENWLDWQRLKDMAEETYKLLKEALKIIREYDWFFDYGSGSMEDMKAERGESELVEIKSKLFDYLREKHTKARNHKKIIRAVGANGVTEFEFETLEDCAKHFGVSRVSMSKYIKSGDYISKLGYSFVEISV